jgi:hypothetical protein
MAPDPDPGPKSAITRRPAAALPEKVPGTVLFPEKHKPMPTMRLGTAVPFVPDTFNSPTERTVPDSPQDDQLPSIVCGDERDACDGCMIIQR